MSTRNSEVPALWGARTNERSPVGDILGGEENSADDPLSRVTEYDTVWHRVPSIRSCHGCRLPGVDPGASRCCGSAQSSSWLCSPPSTRTSVT